MDLKDNFDQKLRKELKNDIGLKSIDAVPVIEKIVVNMGVGKLRENKNYVEEAFNDIAVITGQLPAKRFAKISISNFKLRKGQLAGLMVTLRGKKMWDFYEKLVTITLPRIKDFSGLRRNSFDGSGNYNIGLSEHTVFPEIDANKINYTKPIQITITTTAVNDDDGYKLLKALQMPFKD